MGNLEMSEFDRKSIILVIDDINENIQLIANLLQNNEYLVLTSNSGEHGIKIAESKQPDLILLDIQMPIMDGFETMHLLKNNPLTKHIPVMFLTARTETSDIVKGFEIGAVDYISKPFHSSELLTRIKYQLQLKLSTQIINSQNLRLIEVNKNLEKAYIELQQEQEKVVEMEKLKSVLAMAVTTNHELNQPLTVIQACIEMLVINFPDLEKNKHISKIIDSINAIVVKMQKFSNFDKIIYRKYTDNVDMISIDYEKED